MFNFRKIAVASAIIFSSAQTTYANDLEITTVVEGLNSPWAIEFLPNNDILITEHGGKLRIIRGGILQDNAISGTPDVYFAGQGGLLDVMLDVDFAKNQKLYLSYATGDHKANSTQLMSATLEGMSLKNQRILFTASPMKSTAHHFAGRIAQMDDGSVLLTIGDGFNYREQAQTLDNHFGKIIRINQDGSPHKDNPFLNTDNAKPEIWSYGHRNMQALSIVNGVVYENEHGPEGGDEVNIIEPGLNYGWPVISYGIDYNGAQITPYTEYQGMQQPKINWTPSIAPSSMAYHKGHLYVTSLAEQSVRKLSIDGDQIKDNGIVFKQLNTRLRDIASAPDGKLYILTDGGNAKLVKLSEGVD
jgi:glucose/arabinose dehydrogenase